MENPIKMDDLGVPLFSETSISFHKLFDTILHVTWGFGASGGCRHFAQNAEGIWQHLGRCASKFAKEVSSVLSSESSRFSKHKFDDHIW